MKIYYWPHCFEQTLKRVLLYPCICSIETVAEGWCVLIKFIVENIKILEIMLISQLIKDSKEKFFY